MHGNRDYVANRGRIFGMGPLGWGLLSLFCNVMGLPSLFAWITGAQTLSELRRGNDASPGSRWKAWTGIALGTVWPLAVTAGLIAGIVMAPPEFWHDVQGLLAHAGRGGRAVAAEPAPVEAEPVDYLVLPEEHTPSTPLPVLIWLHGYGASPTVVLDSYFERLANRYGIAVLGVSGPWRYQPEDSKEPSLNAFRWSEDPKRDAQRVQEALSRKVEQLTPEAGRILFFGFSQGAVVAAELAARDPEKYAGAILLSPGSLNQRAPVQLEHASVRQQQYVISVGAEEHPGNRAMAKDYHDRLRTLGHRSQLREVDGQDTHAFPADFYVELPRWMERLLKSRGGVVERTTERALVDAVLTDYVDTHIREGFLTSEEIIEAAGGWIGSTSLEEPLEELTAAVLERRMELQAREEKEWPAVTDNDRLDRAFASLEEAGIVARQHYEDCGTCGAAAIYDELSEAREAGRNARGYVFFHMQDTESAAAGGGLYLSYGAWEDGEAAAVAIGHEVVSHLKKAGLKTEWDGTHERRIGVVEFDWKRRRITTAPGGSP